MPKYTNSRHTQGIQFVEIDGVSYRKTGNFKSISSVTHVPDEDVKLLYVDSCSGADFGQQELTNGSTVDIPETQQEFQIKFDGGAGDVANVVLKNTAGDCNIEVSVNVAGQLVWDSGTGGVAYTFTTIGEVLNYTDCNNNTYDVVYAGTGSWIITVKKTGNSGSSSGGGGGGSTNNPQTWNYVLSLDNTTGSLGYVFEGDLPGGTAGYNLPTTITVGDTIDFDVYNEGASAGSYLRISHQYDASSSAGRMLDGDWMPAPYDPTDLTDTYDTRAEFATYGSASYDPTLVGFLTSGNVNQYGQLHQHMRFKPLLSGEYTIENSIETGATATITVVDPAGSTTTYTPNQYSAGVYVTSNGVDFSNYNVLVNGSYEPGFIPAQNDTIPLTAGDKITFALNENTTTFQIVSSDCGTAYDPTHQLTQGDHADYSYTVTPNTDTMVEITFKTAGTWYYRDTRYANACGTIEVVAS